MMRRKIFIKILFVLIGISPIVILISCDGTTGPYEEIIFPDVDVSFRDHVQPLFLQRCATSGCHTDQSMAGNLSLTSYHNATAKPGIIVPNDADASILIQRVEGTIQPRMPFQRQPLTPNQIRGLRTWINKGALNN